MDNDGAVFPAMLFQPRNKLRRVTVAAAATAECMNSHRKFADPRIVRRIQRNNFDAMSAIRQNSGGLFDRLHRATDRRIKRMNGPKYFHSGWVNVVLRNGPRPRCSTIASNECGRFETGQADHRRKLGTEHDEKGSRADPP